MKRISRTLIATTAAAALVLGFAACDSDDGDGGTTDTVEADTTTGDTTPADTTPPEDTMDDMDDTGPTPTYTRLQFVVDDSANKTYADRDLEWKGSFAYDEATNVLTFDSSWPGPYPALFDDGPISEGGHEAEGQTAGDNILSVEVLVETPTEELTIEYGLQNKDEDWLWVGANGTVVIPAGDQGPIVATGLTFEAFGTIDMKLTMDTAAIDADFMPVVPAVTTITVKGSAWAWSEVALLDDGMNGDDAALDGIYTFILSDNATGLLKVGDKPEFVWVVGGVEYKDGNSDALPTGIKAYTDWETAGTWTEEKVANLPPGAFGANTFIEVGGADE